MQATQYGPCSELASVWRSGPDKRSVGRLQSDSDEILGPHRLLDGMIGPVDDAVAVQEHEEGLAF